MIRRTLKSAFRVRIQTSALLIVVPESGRRRSDKLPAGGRMIVTHEHRLIGVGRVVVPATAQPPEQIGVPNLTAADRATLKAGHFIYAAHRMIRKHRIVGAAQEGPRYCPVRRASFAGCQPQRKAGGAVVIEGVAGGADAHGISHGIATGQPSQKGNMLDGAGGARQFRAARGVGHQAHVPNVVEVRELRAL